MRSRRKGIQMSKILLLIASLLVTATPFTSHATEVLNSEVSEAIVTETSVEESTSEEILAVEETEGEETTPTDESVEQQVMIETQADSPLPDVFIGAFWNSTNDQTNNIYMSLDGLNFQKLSTPFVDSDPNSEVNDNWRCLHDPSIIYQNGWFYMMSGYTQTQNGTRRFTPMISCSQDLINWSVPGSYSAENVIPTTAPLARSSGTSWNFDSVAPDFMIDDDGTAYIVVSLGYYGQFHGEAQVDRMSPYLIEVTGLDGNNMNGIRYSEAQPINLPENNDNRIDGSLYKEGGYFYFIVKKDGIANEIWRTTDLNDCSNKNAWTKVCANAVTGYEGPSLTKAGSTYYLYTDKLGDYPYQASDGTTGVFLTRSNSLSSGWSGTQRITTTDINGRSISNRHGTVIRISDPTAKAKVWTARTNAGYGGYETDNNGNPFQGWITKDGKKYWYDTGVCAVSKEVYDPGSKAWYWFDADGTMAKDKDVYQPAGNKWVRYDGEGHMRKGEDYRYGGWYWLEPTTGAMTKGFVFVPSNGGKWVFYDYVNGKMHHGISKINNNWYYFDQNTGKMAHGWTTLPDGRRVHYDEVTGILK